ncbi:MAG: hypothetical protein RLZ92_955 [Pseudomonadota bacterium]|jgi:hypothetical protein
MAIWIVIALGVVSLLSALVLTIIGIYHISR